MESPGLESSENWTYFKEFLIILGKNRPKISFGHSFKIFLGFSQNIL